MTDVNNQETNNLNKGGPGSACKTVLNKGLIYVLIVLFAVGGMFLSKKSQGPALPKIPFLKIEADAPGTKEPDPNLAVSTAWPEVPKMLPVYKRVPIRVNDDYVNMLTGKFGIRPKKQDGTRGYLAIIDEDMDTLNINTYGFRYTTRDAFDNRGINLPGDREAEKIAVKFLKERDLLPAEKYSISIDVAGTMGRYDPMAGKENVIVSSKSVIFRRFLGDYEDANSVITVDLGDNGKITGVHTVWPGAEAIADYPVISPKQAFAKLKNGETVTGNYLQGEVDRVYLTYMTHSETDNPASDYFQPVYVFIAGDKLALVAAVKEGYVLTAGDEEGINSKKYINRTKSIKQYGMPGPIRIKQLREGKIQRILTPEQQEFHTLVEQFKKIVVDSMEIKGSVYNFETDQNPWSEARQVIERGEAYQVTFSERVKISTSLDPSDAIELDKYGNHVIHNDRILLVQSGPATVELIYEDGKHLFMKKISGTLR